MARKVSDLGELAIAIALKTAALEQGLKDVEKKLKTHSNNVKDTGASYDKLAVMAGLAFWKISSAITNGIDIFNKYNNAFTGLKSIVQGTGNDFSKAQKFIENFTNDGLVNAADAATALKNLLSRGYTDTQAIDVLNRLKDSASFGRQASLGLGEAISSATEGLKNENSILVDNAGVTKNVAKMWEDYAKSINKSTNDLTKAEKIQAEYNGIMQETKYQVGDAQKLMLQLSGTQAKYAKSNTDLNKSFGEALAPALKSILEIMIPINQGLTNFVKNNQELVTVATIAVATLTGVITVFAGGVVIVRTLTTVLAGFNLTLKALALNPATIAFTALAVAIGVVATKMAQAKKAQEEYRANLDKLNKTIQRTENINIKGIATSEIDSYKSRKKALEEYIATFEKLNKERNSIINISGNYTDSEATRLKELNTALDELNKNAEGLNIPIVNSFGSSSELMAIKNEYKAINKELSTTEAINSDAYNTKAKEIASQRQTIEETKNLIDTYKQAKKGTSEWVDAEKRLAELFPQFSSINGLKINQISNLVMAQDSANKSAWTLFQDDVKRNKETLEMIKQTKLSLIQGYSAAGRLSPEDATAYTKISKDIEAINNALEIYNDYAKMGVAEVPGITPVRSESTKSNSSEKTAYEKAIELYQHRKNLGQLTLQDEIKILNDIKSKHVKNAEDRMDIEERIYNAKQEMIEKNKQVQEQALAEELKLIQEQEDKLNKRTNNSLRWINRQKLYGEIDDDAEIQAYQRIIKYHKEYIAKVEADEKISKEEKQRIREEELDLIEDQEDKIFSIKKSYIEKSIEEYMNAKRKELDAEEQAEDERLNKKLSAIDDEYDEKEAIKKETELTEKLTKLRLEEGKYINAQTSEGQERLKSIQEDIAKATEDMEKDRLDKEKDMRKKSIEQEIDDNKDKYQKLKDDLDKSKEDMLSKATEYAQQIQNESTNASNSLVDAMSNLFKNWENETDIMMKNSLNKLQNFINQYKNKILELQLGGFAGGKGLMYNLGSLTGMASNVVLNVNDNGDKIINSKDETIDYTNELFNTAKNSLRSIGGGF